MSSLLEKYEPVIGLEIHSQLLTESKMFCSCENRYGVDPNTLICPVCTGQPGSLPVINKKAIELGLRAAMAIHAEIHTESVFSRKNYFYPDLPKGYQITQYDLPFCTNGKLIIRLKDGVTKQIGVTRIHFEEDAGKSLHGSDGTRVDLNRAGVPLIEIVSEPDLRTSEEAGQYLRTMRNLVRYLDVCDGNMEEGSFRCDANISVRLRGAPKFGTRTELKNINSFKYVEKAIDYEIERQIEVIESGGTVIQQTRSWNSAKQQTEVMRSKEDAHDYRYFPEPDLPVLVISDEWKDSIRSKMPELPDEKLERFKTDFGLSDYDASVLTSTKELASYFENVAVNCGNHKAAANWVMNELLGRLNAVNKEILDTPVTSENLAKLIQRINEGKISGKIAKTVFEEMFESSEDPDAIIENRGLVQISDSSSIEPTVIKVIENNADAVKNYKAGKTKLFGFFVGQVLKETGGKANPKLVNDLVKKHLDK